MRDPYSNTQTRFERTDRTGRWSHIEEPAVPEPWWMAVLGGAAMGVAFAVALYLAI